MKILITGGAGFIGSHLCDFYVARGHSVTVLDNFSSGSINNLHISKKSIKVINGDIRNKKLVEKLVSKSDVVLHMAAALGVDNIMLKTLDSISTNIYGSEVVLMAAANHNKRILISSSSEVYGKNIKQPLVETDDRIVGAPQNFRWTYSDSKAIEESMAKVLYLERNLRVTTVRLFNTIGPRQSGSYGMVVPNFVKKAICNDDLLVYGNGNQTRVFCHVSDVVSAITKLMESDLSIGELFNVGGEGEISISDLAKTVKTTLKSSSKIRNVPYTQIYSHGYEDMQRRVPDTAKLRSLIQWAPLKDLSETILDIAKNSNM